MGRLNSQANTKGGNTKYDEDERYKVSETDNTKYADNDKHFKPDKFANKQKDRNNRSYKTDPINDKPEYKRYNDRYARQNYRAEASDYDQDRRPSVHEKEYKEHSKPLTKTEENRKRSDWKFDHKNKSKDEQDGARNNDAEKPSAKYEEKQGTSGKDRKELGRNYNNKPVTPNQQSSKKCEALPITAGNKDQKESMGTTETASPIGPTKEKERSGKSYSSKRRERQQQRNEQ